MKGLTSSPKLNVMLSDMGISTPLQVVEHLPRRYDCYAYTPRSELFHLQDKQRVVLFGTLIGTPKTVRFKRLLNTKFFFRDEWGNDYQVVAWNRSYLSRFLQEIGEFTLQATYDAKHHELDFLNAKKGRIDVEHSMVPIYTLPQAYPDHAFRQLVEKSLLGLKGSIKEVVPDVFRNKYRLCSRYDAYWSTHFPKSQEDLRQGSRALKYEEALLFSLKNQLIRKANKALTKDQRRHINHAKLASFLMGLPFGLTEDQRNVVKECLADMDSPSLMYRLLQGDVGTGKTLVAAVLMYANHLRSEQSALMAPTDALARQHYETLKGMFEEWGMTVTLLVGGMTPQERRAALEDIEDGTSDVIVGTHALFSESVSYAYLGLVIIDEQHKFGVNQRTLLASKGSSADVLLMSATPIPRTLSMTVYGDLDVSTLTQFPSGKRAIETKLVRSNAAIVQKSVQKALETKHRVYVVAPQIEGNDEDSASSVLHVYEEYKAAYPNQVVMLHGKMNDEEKNVALLAFKTGLCPILVATSVIEVGIDVKEANLMVIYDPSHFALSSLHQLRGRIGRGGDQSLCLLAYDGNDEDEREKLQVLVNLDDGFAIAEEDLKRRGPGTLAGTRQSGLPEFNVANIVADFKMFECARDDATYVLAHPEEKGFADLIALASVSLQGISLA